jgi:hypothetical protein
MRTFTVVLAAGTMLLFGVGSAAANCNSSEVIQVGAISGNSEIDTIGLNCADTDVENTGSVRNADPEKVVGIGAITGLAEKDSVGFQRGGAE